MLDLCPKCQSISISLYRHKIDATTCIQSVVCNDCSFHYKVEWIVVTTNSIPLRPPISEFNEQRSISDAIAKTHTTNLEMERQLL
jgi:hypothetical protein